MALVLRLPANAHGRDFVVGDIHGSFDLVLQGMKEIGFDRARDRLFCVGDLVDRGRGSERVLDFLAQPYVFSVRGNHEDMFLELYENGEPHPAVFDFVTGRNGMQWWRNVEPAKRADFLAAFAALPVIIEVATARGSVGLVHADIPDGMDWARFCAGIEAGDKAVLKTALWGRERVKHEVKTGVRGIDRVFVGHTPLWNGLRRFGNVYAIDTGAVFRDLEVEEAGRLTMADVVAKTVILDEPRSAQRVDVRTDSAPFDHPFGQYAQ